MQSKWFGCTRLIYVHPLWMDVVLCLAKMWNRYHIIPSAQCTTVCMTNPVVMVPKCAMIFINMREGIVMSPELSETGNEPEYFVTDLVRIEVAGESDLRLFFAARRGSSLRVEYTAIVPRAALQTMNTAAEMLIAQLDRRQSTEACAMN